MRAPTLDLSLLRTLVAIADTGSVTAAARRLAYTQSTVSMQLSRLEAALGVALHEREGRRIRFTAEGERLLGHARRLLALYSPGADLFREVAEEALAAAGRDWRVAYTSQSMAGLAPVVQAGLAIVVVTRSMLGPQLRTLDETSGLPPLPAVELALHRAARRPTEPARRLAELIREQLSPAGPSA